MSSFSGQASQNQNQWHNEAGNRHFQKRSSQEAPPASATGDAEALRLSVKRKSRPKFTPELLTGPKGLTKIYEEFPGKVELKGPGYEGIYVRKLIEMYRDWAYELFPGATLEDLLARIESSHGRKREVLDHLAELQDRENKRFRNANLFSDGSLGSTAYQQKSRSTQDEPDIRNGHTTAEVNKRTATVLESPNTSPRVGDNQEGRAKNGYQNQTQGTEDGEDEEMRPEDFTRLQYQQELLEAENAYQEELQNLS